VAESSVAQGSAQKSTEECIVGRQQTVDSQESQPPRREDVMP
jgi:hypothetical protein